MSTNKTPAPATISAINKAALEAQPELPLDKKQKEILSQILASKNDNDPRLDTDLRILSENVKEAIVQKYSHTAPEARNERGTLIFLLGRNLKTPQDITFLADVLNEAPCLSLSQCGERPQSFDPHVDGTNSLTLIYPQIVALKSIENYLNQNSTTPLLAHIRSFLSNAEHHPHPAVARLAGNILKKTNRF